MKRCTPRITASSLFILAFMAILPLAPCRVMGASAPANPSRDNSRTTESQLPPENCTLITGQVMLDNLSNDPLASVDVFLENMEGVVLDATTTDADGKFNFCQSLPGSYRIRASAALQSGGITAADALLALSHYVGISLLEGLALQAANVDANAYVNSTDALLILRRFTGQIDLFPGGNWVFDAAIIEIVEQDTVNVNLSGRCMGDLDGSYSPSVACPPFMIADGRAYPTLTVGNQCWMKENLDVGTMIDSTSSQSDNGIIEKHCYNDDPAKCAVYGGLYQWNEMMQYVSLVGGQGICPDGWHVPSLQDWCDLLTYLDATVNCSSTNWTGVDVGGQLKEAGYEHWTAPNTGATNQSGFTALPAGYRATGAYYNNLSQYSYFWSSSPYQGSKANYYLLNTSHADVQRYNYPKTGGMSVRCLKDMQE